MPGPIRRLLHRRHLPPPGEGLGQAKVREQADAGFAPAPQRGSLYQRRGSA